MDESTDSPQDNLEAAMYQVAETTSKGRSSNTGTKKGEPASKQVLIRANEVDHERWKQAADAKGVSMSEFIRDCLNDRARELLDCAHPLNQRRWYPWSEMCLACGQRLRNGPEPKTKK
jgi:predicted DNA binding CopG/RHH family protein